MRFFRRSLVGLMLVALTLGLLTMAGVTIRNAIEAKMSRATTPPQARERVFAANVVMVSASDTAPVITTFGEIRSRRTLE